MPQRETHPAADLFPLMGDGELEALADDIRANGQRQPIVVDGDGRVLDGRNRALACERLGIEPDTTTVNGDDPLALVVSLNVKRRNMTAGQRAIAAAEAWDAVTGSRSRPKNKQLAAMFGCGHDYVQQARALVERDRAGADAVKAGGSLAETYEALRKRERDAASDDKKLAALVEQAPDLADAVSEGRMKLNEAAAAATERERQRSADVALATSNITRALGLLPDEIDAAQLDVEAIEREDVARCLRVLKALQRVTGR